MLDSHYIVLKLNEVEEAVKSSFQKAVEEFSDICAFALYTDESFLSLSVSVNTTSHLEERQADDPEFAEEYKWTPAEWKIENFNDEAFTAINNQLKDERLLSEKDEKSLSEHRQDILRICLPILQNLRKDLASELEKDFVLLFAVSDFDDQDFEINIVKSLNPPQLSNEFINWRTTF